MSKTVKNYSRITIFSFFTRVNIKPTKNDFSVSENLIINSENHLTLT